MADIYMVLGGAWRDNGSGSARVVVRFDTPTGSNGETHTWVQCLLEKRILDGQVGETDWPGGAVTSLDDGTVVEFIYNHSTNLNRSGLAAELETRVIAEIVAKKSALQDQLQYWGREATV